MGKGRSWGWGNGIVMARCNHVEDAPLRLTRRSPKATWLKDMICASRCEHETTILAGLSSSIAFALSNWKDCPSNILEQNHWAVLCPGLTLGTSFASTQRWNIFFVLCTDEIWWPPCEMAAPMCSTQPVGTSSSSVRPCRLCQFRPFDALKMAAPSGLHVQLKPFFHSWLRNASSQGHATPFRCMNNLYEVRSKHILCGCCMLHPQICEFPIVPYRFPKWTLLKGIAFFESPIVSQGLEHARIWTDALRQS